MCKYTKNPSMSDFFGEFYPYMSDEKCKKRHSMRDF